MSDAVVFIVSEETGIISLAAGGKIFRDPLLKRADSLTLAVLKETTDNSAGMANPAEA